MYLGCYFDRHYHCERKDKLSWGSPWRRCVPPPSCSDFHRTLSTPSSLPISCLEHKDCGVLFGWLLGLCWQRLQGSGYHRQKVWPWHRCPDNCPLCKLQSYRVTLSLRLNSDARLSDIWCSGEHLLKVHFKKLKNQSTKQRVRKELIFHLLIKKASTLLDSQSGVWRRPCRACFAQTSRSSSLDYNHW